MPSKLQHINRAGLYRKAYDRKRFVIFVANSYYESRYFNSYTALKRGRMVVYTGEDGMLGKCNIGLIVSTMADDDMVRVRIIPQQHLKKEGETKFRAIHASDVYCYLEQVAGIKITPKPKEKKKLYRFWSVYHDNKKHSESTIDVSENLQKLLAERNKRQKAADEYSQGMVTYYVREV